VPTLAIEKTDGVQLYLPQAVSARIPLAGDPRAAAGLALCCTRGMRAPPPPLRIMVVHGEGV